MKRIIKLTESDLTRIVRRVINERRYLMEQRGSGIVYIYLPYKMENNQKRVATEAFSNADYAPTYSFPLGVAEKTEKYTIKSIETPDGNKPQLMTQEEVKGSDGNINIEGKLGGFTLPKPFNWGPQASQGVVYFSDGQNKQYNFSFKVGKQYIPTQK